MEPINSLSHVAEFHKTFKHPIEPEPLIPSEKRCKLRVSLLAEELKELEEAIENKDIVAVADALCDLQYVLSGAVLEFGLGKKFPELFNEVQRSNMSKVCHSVEEAEKTIAHYKNRDNTEAYYTESAGKYLVYRKSDNKTLKSVFYSPADLEKIVKSK
ncbi:nucleoside triphosphate pyrophosphohydrolase family protein [Sporocytophaga myxococcoides]|uniref:nucleoside triphosphate pyrophosphohydrolase family protein n=1 Tax=Sporocytophaga myxococcoides TaxID=153721 RepID=UPI0003F7D9B1|nr:nucleoside triphosphate pyrophosphohydrolase family protein [Sporocytophaga myxococcoides]